MLVAGLGILSALNILRGSSISALRFQSTPGSLDPPESRNAGTASSSEPEVELTASAASAAPAASIDSHLSQTDNAIDVDKLRRVWGRHIGTSHQPPQQSQQSPQPPKPPQPPQSQQQSPQPPQQLLQQPPQPKQSQQEEQLQQEEPVVGAKPGPGETSPPGISKAGPIGTITIRSTSRISTGAEPLKIEGLAKHGSGWFSPDPARRLSPGGGSPLRNVVFIKVGRDHKPHISGAEDLIFRVARRCRKRPGPRFNKF